MTDETQPTGATSGDDTSGLILVHLTTRTDRNAAEAEAIGLAYDKYVFEARRKKRGAQWLTDDFIRTGHGDMFGSVWEWAGQYRKDKLNIGVDPNLIPEQIRLLCDDFSLWDSPTSVMPVLEVAARLQNRLTKIHPFRNGNGRHARLITDIFFHSRQHPLPQWPQIHLLSQGHKLRAQYITAMKIADQGDFSALIQFIEGCLPKPA
jgi:Fic-DOC domain mobile mystery protein B